jgi:hypothetical protein
MGSERLNPHYLLLTFHPLPYFFSPPAFTQVSN